LIKKYRTVIYPHVGGNIYWTEKMIDTLSTPWDFHNNDKKAFSSKGTERITYGDLNEIAMGAPIGGPCYLETEDRKIKINDWCGGPPAWETEGSLVAIPIWTRKFFKGTVQQIGVVDTRKGELKVFSKTFDVLDMRSFDKQIIYGYDSPIYKTKTVTFDTTREKIDKIIRLWK
jgi:hypothetical protein